MKHLDDINNDLQTGSTGTQNHPIDTRMDSIRPTVSDTPPTWNRPTEPEYVRHHPKVGSARIFFVVAMVFFVGCLGYFFYTFTVGGVSATEDRINVSIVGTSFVTSGVESNYDVIVENTNRVSLEKAVLVLSVPQQAGRADKVQKKILEKLKPGESRRESFPVTLYGAQFEDKKITASIEYAFPGSRAVLVKHSDFPIRIADSPVRLTVTGPKELIVGQDVTYEISFQSKTGIQDVGLKIEYPEGFDVTDTSLTPTAGKYYWEFAKLLAGKAEKLTIHGTFKGSSIAGVGTSLRVYIGSQSHDEKLLESIYAVEPYELQVSESVLSAQVSLNGSSAETYPVYPGTHLSGSVLVKNISQNPISNAEITLIVDGNIIDTSTLTAEQGFYNSQNSSIIWSKSSGSAELGLLAPGGSIVLQFNADVGSTLSSDSTGSVIVSVAGVSQTGDSIKAKNIDQITLQQSARLSLIQSTLYTNGVFDNDGPLPPVVEDPTTYTIQWTVPRQIVDYGDVRVTAQLPVYVDWIKSKPTKLINYNPTTREITWSPGLVSSQGATDPTMSFQVKITPSSSQVNTSPALVELVNISGKNLLTGSYNELKKQNHTTATSGDSEDISGNVVAQ